MEAVAALLLLLVVGGAAGALLRRRAGAPAVWLPGLRRTRRGWFARMGTYDVHVERAGSRVAWIVRGGPTDMRMEPRGAGFPADAVASGDAVLDAVAVLRGEPFAVLARLSPPVRAALTRAARAGVRLEDRALLGESAPEALSGHLALATTLLDGLGALLDPREAVAGRASGDPDPMVRLRALEVLRGVDEAAAAALAAADPDPRVRLWAAVARDDRAALGTLLADPAVPLEVRDRAFHLLRESPDVLYATLVRALEDPRAASHALHRISVLDDPALVGAVLGHARALLARDPSQLPREAEALVRVLARGGASDARDVLLALAAEAPDTQARTAIRLLSRDTDPATLAALGDLARRRPELGPVVADVAGLAAVDAFGARVGAAIGLGWDTGTHAATGLVDGVRVELTLGDATVVAALDLPPMPSVIPRPEQLAPLADDAFHRAWRVPGDADDLAWFPPEVRARICAAGEEARSLAVHDGRLRVVAAPGAVEDVARLVAAVAAAAAAIRALPATAEERMRACWRAETSASLRRRLMRAALARDSEAAVVALEDPDPAVVRTAAVALRRGERLVALVADPAVPVGERRGALHDLFSLGDRASLSAGAGAALEDAALSALGVALVGRAGLGEHAIAVARVVERGSLDDPRVKSALHVLAAFADPVTEAALCRGVASSDPEVRRAIVEVLGRIGTSRGLEALKALALGWGAEGDLAGAAIAQIRSRGNQGALALAANEGGQIAIAPTTGPRGELTDPDE